MIAINPDYKHAQLAALPVVRLHGLRINALTESQVVEHILTQLAQAEGGWVVTPNLDILRRYHVDPTFRELIEPASVVLADGMPLVWASRIQGNALPERVAGSNLIVSLSSAAAQADRSIYLLGGDHGTAALAGLKLKQRIEHLTIAGHDAAPPGFESDPKLVQMMLDRLERAKPDIVYVAMGCPKQEQFIAAYRHILPRAWWLGVGISFSFLAGRVRRAPRFVQCTGLEWLHRLVQEPRRLCRRYLLEGLPFAASMLVHAAEERLLSDANGLALKANRQETRADSQ